MASVIALVLPILIVAVALPAWAAEDAMRMPAEEILQRALSNRWEVNLVETADVLAHDRTGKRTRKRRLEIAFKMIEGRNHRLGAFTEPADLRGTMFLSIENRDRSEDVFLFLPELGKVRRVTTAQRGDPWFGTDFFAEDFERRRVDDYRVEVRPDGEIASEPVFRMMAYPQYDSAYGAVEFLVAKHDLVFLEIRHFHAGEEEPFKIIELPRRAMHKEKGYTVAKEILVHNIARGTRSELLVDDLLVDPAIDDRMFSAGSLRKSAPSLLSPGSGGDS